MAARLRDNGEMESECWLKMKCPRQSLSIVTEDHILTDDSHHEGKITFPVCACNHLYCIILIVNAEGLFFMKYCVKNQKKKVRTAGWSASHCIAPAHSNWQYFHFLDYISILLNVVSPLLTHSDIYGSIENIQFFIPVMAILAIDMW